MRRAPPVSLDLPAVLVADARLYSGRAHDLDAVVYILQDYPSLVAELRKLRRRFAQFDQEQLLLDERLSALQDLCRQLLDL